MCTLVVCTAFMHVIPKEDGFNCPAWYIQRRKFASYRSSRFLLQ